MSCYVELNSPRGKKFWNKFWLSLTIPVDNTVGISGYHCKRIFSAKNFHIEQAPMRCEEILTNIFSELGCNEELYHCLRWWCGWMTGNIVWSEARSKVWPLPYSQPVHKSFTHGLNKVLLKVTQVFSAWNNFTSV